MREEFVYERFQLLLFDGKKIGVLDRWSFMLTRDGRTWRFNSRPFGKRPPKIRRVSGLRTHRRYFTRRSPNISTFWRECSACIFKVTIWVSVAYNIDRKVSTRRISPGKFWCFWVLVLFFWYSLIGDDRLREVVAHEGSTVVITELKQHCDVFERRASTRIELFFSFNMPWRHQICMAKRPYSYRDDLSKGLFKITAQECKKFTSDWRGSLKKVAA